MVVRQIRFGVLFLVAPQALLILLPARLDRSRNAGTLTLEFEARLAVSLAMNGVAVAALHVLRLVCARKPVADMIGFGMAAQAHAVRLLRGTVTEANDLAFRFGGVPARSHMQTARPMTLFASNFLHGVRVPSEPLGEIGVTRSALVRPYHLRTGDFREFAEVLPDLVGCASLGFVFRRKRRSKQERNGKEKREEQNTSPHSDLPDH